MILITKGIRQQEMGSRFKNSLEVVLYVCIYDINLQILHIDVVSN